MYAHYIKFRKYGKLQRRKEKAFIIGHTEISSHYFEGDRDALISMLESFLLSLFSY